MHVNKHCRAADNALAETINGLYKIEQVHCQGPWRNMQDLEMAALGWDPSAISHQQRPKRTPMLGAACSIWSREMKL